MNIYFIFISIFFNFINIYLVLSINLSDAINLAIKNNLNIKIVRQNLESITLDDYGIFMSFLPNINLNLIHKRNSLNYLKFNNVLKKNNLLQFIINKEIFIGGVKCKQILSYKSKVKIIYKEYSLIINEIIYKIIKCYYTNISLRIIVSIFKEIIQYYELLLNNIYIMINKGIMKRSFFLIEESELIQMKIEKNLLLKKQNEIEENFLYLIGIKKPLNMLDIDIIKYNIPSIRKLIYNLEKKNINLLLKRWQFNLYKNNIKIFYKKFFFPKIIIIYKYSKNYFYLKKINNNFSFYKNYELFILFEHPLIYNNKNFLIILNELLYKYKNSKIVYKNFKEDIYFNILKIWKNYIFNQIIYKQSLLYKDKNFLIYKLIQKDLNINHINIINNIIFFKKYNMSLIKEKQKLLELNISFFIIYKEMGILINMFNI